MRATAAIPRQKSNNQKHLLKSNISRHISLPKHRFKKQKDTARQEYGGAAAARRMSLKSDLARLRFKACGR
jgi:hypothetical protein